MKKILPLIIAGLLSQKLSAQHIFLRLQDAYTYQNIEHAEIQILLPDGKVYHFSKKHPGYEKIKLPASSFDIKVESRGYRELKSYFNAQNDLYVTFQLEPENFDFAQTYPSCFTILILSQNHFEPVPRAQLQILFPDHKTLNFEIARGKLEISAGKLNLEKYAETDTLIYRIEAPGFEPAVFKDRIPTCGSVKPFYLKPFSKTFAPGLKIRKINRIPGQKHPASASLVHRFIPTRCDRLPSSIRVGQNCQCNSCTSVLVMSLQVYTQKGLNDEWIASWEAESLKAGSLPYRTYGAYYVRRPISSNYDISNTTCKQVWDDDMSSACYNAANNTYGQYLETAGGAIAFSEYSAENNCLNSPDCNCGDGYSGNGTDWPCIPDPVCAGHDRFGHGRGMCQWGSQRWAQQGKTYDSIADHYYNPGHIYRCGTDHPHPDFFTGNAALNPSTGNPGDNIQATCVIRNNTDFKTDKNLLEIYLSADNTLDSNDTLLSSGILWPLDPHGSIQKNLSFQVPNLPNGNYYVLFVSDPENTMYETDETNNTEAIPFTIGITSVDENIQKQFVKLYPNPAKADVKIEISRPKLFNRMDIFDLTGRHMKTYLKIPSVVSIKHLPQGLYFFRFSSLSGRNIYFKIIKK